MDPGRQRTENDSLFVVSQNAYLAPFSAKPDVSRPKSARHAAARYVSLQKHDVEPQCYNSKTTRLLTTNYYTCNPCRSVSFNVTNGVRAMFESLVHCFGIVFGFIAALRPPVPSHPSACRKCPECICNYRGRATTAAVRRRGRRTYRLLMVYGILGNRRCDVYGVQTPHAEAPELASKSADAMQ